MAQMSARVSAKAKAPDVNPNANPYDALDPKSIAEFEECNSGGEEFTFEAAEDANEITKTRVRILNFIHKELHFNTKRQVPILDVDNDDPNIDILHRAIYEGLELDVCVYWPPLGEGEDKRCQAMVKLAIDDLSGVVIHANGAVDVNADRDAESEADPQTEKNKYMVKNFWTPRWRHVVRILKNNAYSHYLPDGTWNPPKEPEKTDKPVAAFGDSSLDSQEEREEIMEVPYASTFDIRGDKYVTIDKIKADSNTEITLPPKIEPKPKRRELVKVTIFGTPRAIRKARKLIQVVVDEWDKKEKKYWADQRNRGNQASAPADGAGAAGSSSNTGEGDGDGSGTWGHAGTSEAGLSGWEKGGETGVGDQNLSKSSGGNN